MQQKKLRWAREWLEEEVIRPVIEAGNEKKQEARRQDYRKYTIPTDIRGKVFPRDLCR
jgi:hypothetical protein